MASGGWSRTLRKLACSDSDSDSGPDLDLGPPSQLTSFSSAQLASGSVQSADTKLMQELDLASRRDEAHYKPNPWTIAKVNAAVRPRQSVQQTHEQAVKPSGPKPPQGPLAEAFKAQSRRKRPTPPSQPTPADDQSCSDTVSTTTLTTHTVQEIASANLALRPHRLIGPAGNMRPLTQPVHNSSQSACSKSLNSGRAHVKRVVPRDRDQDLSQQGALRPELLHSKRELAAQHQLSNPVAENVGIPGYHERKRPSSETQDTFAVQDTRSDSHSGFRLRADLVQSSPPGPRHGFLSSRPLSSTAFSSPMRPSPVYHSLRSHSARRSNPMDFAGLQQSVLTASHRPTEPHPSSHSGAPDTTSKVEFTKPQHSKTTTTRPIHRSDSSAAKPPGSSDNVAPWKGVKCDAYEGLLSPDAEWSTISSSKGKRKKSNGRGATTSSKFRLPITRLSTTESEPDPKRRRISYMPPAPAPEASLPAVWKVTRIMPSQLQEKFKSDVATLSAPAPRAEAKDKLQHEKSYTQLNRDSRFPAARNYPSPPRCNSSPPQELLFRSPNLHIPAQLPPVMSSTSKSASSNVPSPWPNLDALTRHSLPSPPRSDSPSVLQSGMCGGSDGPDGGGSIQLPFNSEMLAERYVKIRRKIAKRKQAAARLWDDLDLPSCGTVYCGPDIPAGVSRETVEIPIVVWQGRDVLNDR